MALRGLALFTGTFSTCYVIHDQVFATSSVSGASMRPTINPDPHLSPQKSVVLVQKFKYEPNRGDVVCVRYFQLTFWSLVSYNFLILPRLPRVLLS